VAEHPQAHHPKNPVMVRFEMNPNLHYGEFHLASLLHIPCSQPTYSPYVISCKSSQPPWPPNLPTHFNLLPTCIHFFSSYFFLSITYITKLFKFVLLLQGQAFMMNHILRSTFFSNGVFKCNLETRNKVKNLFDYLNFF
jgi:hypothetical protein